MSEQTHAHSASVLSGKSQASLATLVSEIAGAASFNLAVSADPQVRKIAILVISPFFSFATFLIHFR